MISDEEARAIEEARRAGTSEPRRLARWVDVLLIERRELVGQLNLIQRQLSVAMRHFDRLCIERANIDWVRTRLQAGATYLDGLFARRNRTGRSPLDDRH